MGYTPLFNPGFQADLRWWYQNEPKKGDKIMDLVADLLDGDPFKGIGIWQLTSELKGRLCLKAIKFVFFNF